MLNVQPGAEVVDVDSVSCKQRDKNITKMKAEYGRVWKDQNAQLQSLVLNLLDWAIS